MAKKIVKKPKLTDAERHAGFVEMARKVGIPNTNGHGDVQLGPYVKCNVA